jgi:hypothetical protein
VASVVATDPDGSTSNYGNPKYSFISGTPSASKFNINSDTGLVTTRALLDADTVATYELVIKVRRRT